MKIDTNLIPGYAEMTAEQKLAALESFEYSDNADELKRYKDAVTKANHEAAEFKRQLKDANANSEKAITDSNTELESIKSQLAALQREKSIAEHKANFIAQGFSEALAIDSATALMDNDSAKLFSNMGKFMAEHDKAIKAQNVGNMPTPAPGTGNPGGVDYNKMISDAITNGDGALAAHYMALQQEMPKT